MKRLWLATLALFLAASLSWAEDLSWQNFTFFAPEGGYVNYCTNNHLEIVWEDMMLVADLQPLVDYDKDTFHDYLTSQARSLTMYDIEKEKIKVKGFQSYAVAGTLPDGSRAILCDLQSKKAGVRLSLTVNYLLGNRDRAEDLIKSFSFGTKKANKQKEPQQKQKIQSPEKAKEAEEAIKKEKELEKLRSKGVLHDA